MNTVITRIVLQGFKSFNKKISIPLLNGFNVICGPNGSGKSNIVDALCEVNGNVIFPCHPRTEKALKKFGLWDKLKRNVNVIKPVGYLDMLVLEKNAKKIITDSGGVQKEAYIFKVPCITLRDRTEWVETVESGWNVLVGANEKKIVEAIRNINRSPIYQPFKAMEKRGKRFLNFLRGSFNGILLLKILIIP